MIILPGLASSLIIWLLLLLFGFEPNLDKNIVECRAEAMRSIRRLKEVSGYSRHNKQIKMLRTFKYPVFRYLIIQYFNRQGYSFTTIENCNHSTVLEGNNDLGQSILIRISQDNRLLSRFEVETFKTFCEGNKVIGHYIHLGYIPISLGRKYNSGNFKIISGSKINKFFTTTMPQKDFAI